MRRVKTRQFSEERTFDGLNNVRLIGKLAIHECKVMYLGGNNLKYAYSFLSCKSVITIQERDLSVMRDWYPFESQ